MKTKCLYLLVCMAMLCGCGVKVGDQDSFDEIDNPFDKPTMCVTQSVVIAVYKDKWIQYINFVNTGEVYTNSCSRNAWLWGAYPESLKDFGKYKEFKSKESKDEVLPENR